MNLKLSCMRALLITGAFLVLNGNALGQATVAYVKDLNGEWHLNNSREVLKKGQALSAGGRLSFKWANTRGSITIADLTGRTFFYKSCGQGQCDGAFVFPSPPATPPSVTTQIFGAVMGLWRSNTARYIILGSRTRGQLQETVLRLQEDQLDLSPAAGKLERGTYLLRFIPLKATADPTPASGLPDVSFDWDAAHPKKLTLKGLKTGAYEVQLLDRADKIKLEPGTEAWVFIASDGEYEGASRLFAQAKTMTTQWAAQDTTADTKRSFLRGYVDYLAGAH